MDSQMNERYDDHIRLNSVEYDGLINSMPPFTLASFSAVFHFGHAYLLDSGENSGSWIVSWMIGGMIPAGQGDILRDGMPYTLEQRRKDAWCVRYSQAFRSIFARNPSVQQQVRYGLRRFNTSDLKSEQEVMEYFELTPQRFARPLTKMSHEAWRASCAIGIVNNKRIFCFPYLDPTHIESTFMNWFPRLIGNLKKYNALIILPTIETPITKTLVDKVIRL